MGMASSACCLGEAACCLGTQAISCCGRQLQCSGAIGYPVIIFLGTVLCIVFRFFLIDHLDSILQHVGGSSTCADVIHGQAKDACYGNQFVYRLGFAMTIFFAAMFFLVICFRKAVNDGAWLLKGMVILGTFIASLWIDDQTMTHYAHTCLYGSAVFIVLQVLILLEWVYSWNDKWRQIALDGDEAYFKYLMAASIGGFVVALVFMVLAIVQFGAAGCTFAIAQIVWTCVAIVGFTVLSVVMDNGSFLCSSMVAAYCAYYCWSSLSGQDVDVLNDAGNQCNTILHKDGSAASTVNIIFGLFLTCFSLAGSAYSSGTGDIGTHHLAHHHQEGCDNTEGDGHYDRMEDGRPAVTPTQGDSDFGASDVVKPLMVYHAVMVLCVMFMIMTIVNWDVNVSEKTATMQDFGTGSTVVWVKALSQWLTIILYVWTLIAKQVLVACCGIEREFDFND